MAKETAGMSGPAIIVAVVVLVGFAGLLYHLFTISSGADERLWNRSIFLYGGVEALAFAAAGFLFGKEVHRQQAETRKSGQTKRRRRPRLPGRKAASVKAKGQSLKTMVTAKVERASAAPAGTYGPLGNAAPDTVYLLAKSDLDEIDRIARELFPD